MSVPTDAVTEQVFVGAGSASPLAPSFKFLDADDLVVTAIVAGTEDPDPLVRGVDYSVAGGNGSTGTVTPLAAIPVGTSWRVRRETPVGQPATLPSGSFQPEQIERALDRQALIAQEQDRELGRAVMAQRGEAGPVLAPLASLAGKLLVMNDDGTEVVGADAVPTIAAALDEADEALDDSKDAALAAIATDRDSALSAIGSAGDTELAAIDAAGTAKVGEVNSAGAAQVAAVGAEGATQISAIEAEALLALEVETETLSRGYGAVDGPDTVSTLHWCIVPFSFETGDIIDALDMFIKTAGAGNFETAFVQISSTGVVTALTAGPTVALNATGLQTINLGGYVCPARTFVAVRRAGSTTSAYAQTTAGGNDMVQRFLGTLTVGSDFGSTTIRPHWQMRGRRPFTRSNLSARQRASEIALGGVAGETRTWRQGVPLWRREGATTVSAGTFLLGQRVQVSGELDFRASVVTAGLAEIMIYDPPAGGLVAGDYTLVRRVTVTLPSTGSDVLCESGVTHARTFVRAGQVVAFKDVVGQIGKFSQGGLYALSSRENIEGQAVAIQSATQWPGVELSIRAPLAVLNQQEMVIRRRLRGTRSAARTNFAALTGLTGGAWTASSLGLTCPAASGSTTYFSQLFLAQRRTQTCRVRLVNPRRFGFVWAEGAGGDADQNGGMIEIDTSAGFASATLKVYGRNGSTDSSALLISRTLPTLTAGRDYIIRIVKNRFDYLVEMSDAVTGAAVASVSFNFWATATTASFHMLGPTGFITLNAGSAGDVIIRNCEIVNHANRNFHTYVPADSLGYGGNGATALGQSTDWDWVDWARGKGDWLVAGFPGKTTATAIAQLPADFTGTQCERLLLAHMTNSASLASFQADVATIAATCAAQGAELILCTGPAGSPATVAVANSINAWIRDSGYRFVDRAAVLFTDPADAATYIPGLFADTGTHMNQAGYWALARAYPFIAPFLFDGSGYTASELLERMDAQFRLAA